MDIVKEAVAKKAKNSRRSNIVKRFFSRAKLIIRDQRKLMGPQHLELLHFSYGTKLPLTIL